MIRTTFFNCSTPGCGLRLVARIIERRTRKIEFYLAGGPVVQITACPNCQRDFSRATAEQFEEEHGRNWS